MNKKRKRGIVLLLIGLGIILFFLLLSSPQSYFEFRKGSEPTAYYEKRVVKILGLEFPYKYPLVAGGIVALIGAGMTGLSFIQKKEEPKKQ